MEPSRSAPCSLPDHVVSRSNRQVAFDVSIVLRSLNGYSGVEVHHSTAPGSKSGSASFLRPDTWKLTVGSLEVEEAARCRRYDMAQLTIHSSLPARRAHI